MRRFYLYFGAIVLKLSFKADIIALLQRGRGLIQEICILKKGTADADPAAPADEKFQYRAFSCGLFIFPMVK